MKRRYLRKGMPLLTLAAAAALHAAVPNSPLQPAADEPYYLYFLGILAGAYIFSLVLSLRLKRLEKKLFHSAPLYSGAVFLMALIDLAVSKYALLPVLYFPALDRVFGVFSADYALLLECVISSGVLLLRGFAWGATLGFLTGVLIGYSQTANYWLSPLMKFVGPIPPVSWSPLVLSLFTRTDSAAVFMVALAVWFPVTLMTGSGVQNVDKIYFEAGATLGAGRLRSIFRIAVPAAMPSIFLGIFYATCSSFVTLVTAELLGAGSGLGWYLNWQKSMMLYANVYAGLILMAVLCTFIITMELKIKDRILVWQRGLIRW